MPSSIKVLLEKKARGSMASVHDNSLCFSPCNLFLFPRLLKKSTPLYGYIHFNRPVRLINTHLTGETFNKNFVFPYKQN